jgi:predicted metal-dependent hydrolase
VTRSVWYGTQRLAYQLRFAETARLSISVHPDLSVTVRAPHRTPPASVDARVRARAPWILRQQRRFERFHPLPVARRFVSGETHLYLGRQYRLRIRRGPEAVQLSGPFLWVHARHPSPRTVERLLRLWYRERARIALQRRVSALLRVLPWLAERELRFRLAELKRCWGSCGRSGLITLNVELVKAPTLCIDYVLAHELCHLVERRHSRRFLRLMHRAMPGWERARDRLNVAVR